LPEILFFLLVLYNKVEKRKRKANRNDISKYNFKKENTAKNNTSD
jgi:hypothetical protein